MGSGPGPGAFLEALSNNQNHIAGENPNQVLTCAGIATLSGLLTSLSVFSLAYPKRLEEERGWSFSSRMTAFFYFFNVAFSIAQAGAFIVAVNFGSVSLTMPVSCGSGLLFNMILQMCFQVKDFTKSMRVGTLVIVFSVICLVDIGPDEPDPQPDVLVLIMQPAALVSIASLTLLCALALAASKTVLSYAAVVASTAVLNATCAKLLTLTAGFHFGLAAGAYLITGLVCMVCNALACACVDTALYAPTVPMDFPRLKPSKIPQRDPQHHYISSKKAFHGFSRREEKARHVRIC